MTRKRLVKTALHRQPQPHKQIDIADRQHCLVLPRQLLRRIVSTVLAGEGRQVGEISLAFVTDDCMAQLHQQFLGVTGPTDVLTFPLGNLVENQPYSQQLPAVSGEIVISTETARRQARQRRHDPVVETCLYVIHGLLHLCGYDDTTPAARRQMQRRQRYYLRQLGLQLRRTAD